MNMLVHKSSLLLFEKWKKMSQISVLIMLSRWRQAFMCRGSAPAFLVLYVNSDSHLIVMENTESAKWKVLRRRWNNGKERRPSECGQSAYRDGYYDRERKNCFALDIFIKDQQGFLGGQSSRWFIEAAHSRLTCTSRGLFSYSRQHLRNMFVCSSGNGRIGYNSAHGNWPVSPRIPETFSKRVAVNL